MAQSNQNQGVNALIIGNNTPYLIAASITKDNIVTLRNEQEQFIPIQQILDKKVKLLFNDLPKEAGNFEIYNKKEPIGNLSFNYNRAESNLDLANENAVSDYTKIDSIAAVFDTLQTNRTDNQIWKWFLIFALLFLVTEMAIIRFVK
jgi:hypothetical protein